MSVVTSDTKRIIALETKLKALEEKVTELEARLDDHRIDARIYANTNKLIEDNKAMHNLLVSIATQVNLLSKGK